MIRLLACLFLTLHLPIQAADLKVATLHPLLADLARQVGGSHVQVIDLIGPNGDPHHFEPKPEDLQKAAGASLYLVSGMGLETYLPKLRGVITDSATLVEVGATLPALTGSDCDEHGETAHSPHDHQTDPHWWHSIDRFRRATTVVATAMSVASPENAEDFTKNAAAYRSQLDELKRWTKLQIAAIPRTHRHLATAHAAFNYFCKDHAFTPHAIQGLSQEQMPNPQQLASLIAKLKADQVAAIFPEKESNPKILQTLTTDTGIRLGEPLIADGTGGISYLEMVRHNVTAIVKGLKK
jgi:zinc/manganese transport system substrate-binding protein